MSNFDRFRNKNLNKIVSTTKVNSDFVLKGYPTIEITFANGETQCVSLVNKQEREMAYVYSKECEPLKVGEVFSCKELKFLISEEVTIIKDVHFRKYIALLCNVDLGNGEWGYFKGSEKSYINLALKKDDVVISQQKPILVARQGLFDINDIVEIKGRPWLITESDITSSNDIGYYSLVATTKKKEDYTPLQQEKVQRNLELGVVIKSGDKITLTTEMGYFESAVKFDDLDLKLSQVEFTVPFGINNFAVKVQQNGQIKEIKYIVK